MKRTRKLGHDGPTVSGLGIGAMSFSNFYGPVDEAQSHRVLDAARELGVTHIDTADIYGQGASETRIGRYLKQNPSAKDDFHIATKGSIVPQGAGDKRFNNEAAYLTQALDASLIRLGVDFVDLYYVHRRDTDLEIEEVTETLAGFVKAGKIGGFGYSEISPTTIRRAQAVHPIRAIQSEYSLSTRTPELGVLQACADLDITFVAFSPVGRSLLTDRPHTRAIAENLPFLANNPRFMEPNLSWNIERAAGFRALAADMGLTAAGLSISWALSQGSHVLPIPGTRSVDHLSAMVQGAERVLTTDELATVDAALPMGWVNGDRYSADQWNGPERYA